jgi:hypothetical protein
MDPKCNLGMKGQEIFPSVEQQDSLAPPFSQSLDKAVTTYTRNALAYLSWVKVIKRKVGVDVIQAHTHTHIYTHTHTHMCACVWVWYRHKLYVCLSSLVWYFWARPEPTLVEHLSCALFRVLLSLLANIRPGACTIKHYESVIYGKMINFVVS